MAICMARLISLVFCEVALNLERRFTPRRPRFPITGLRFALAPKNTINRPYSITPLQPASSKEQMTSQNSTRDNNNSFNTTNSYNNVWNNYTIADDRSLLLTWLSPLEPRLRHRDIQERRVDNVGEWLLQTDEFRSWQSGSGESEGGKEVLFCYGGPGVGKTFIR